MRLIDADLLKSFIDKSEKKSISVLAVKGCINNTATVDAIPMEWIEEWETKHPTEELGDMLNDWAERKEA